MSIHPLGSPPQYALLAVGHKSPLGRVHLHARDLRAMLRRGKPRLYRKHAHRSIRRSIRVARPVWSSHSTSTAHRRTSPLAASKRAGIPLRNLSITSSFFTPMTLSYGPVMPTSVM